MLTQLCAQVGRRLLWKGFTGGIVVQDGYRNECTLRTGMLRRINSLAHGDVVLADRVLLRNLASNKDQVYCLPRKRGRSTNEPSLGRIPGSQQLVNA